jgi:CBS domain-containing protein
MNTCNNRNIDRYNRAALSSVDSLFDNVRVDAISEPLLSVCDTETIGHAASIMQERRFDVLGVTHAGRVTGYVSNAWNGIPLDPSSVQPS